MSWKKSPSIVWVTICVSYQLIEQTGICFSDLVIFLFFMRKDLKKIWKRSTKKNSGNQEVNFGQTDRLSRNYRALRVSSEWQLTVYSCGSLKLTWVTRQPKSQLWSALCVDRFEWQISKSPCAAASTRLERKLHLAPGTSVEERHVS